MSTKEAHQEKFDLQLEEQQGVKLDELKDKTEAEAKIDYYEQMYSV